MAVLPSVHTTDDDYETLEMMVSPDNDTPTPRPSTRLNRHDGLTCATETLVVRIPGNG